MEAPKIIARSEKFESPSGTKSGKSRLFSRFFCAWDLGLD